MEFRVQVSVLSLEFRVQHYMFSFSGLGVWELESHGYVGPAFDIIKIKIRARSHKQNEQKLPGIKNQASFTTRWCKNRCAARCRACGSMCSWKMYKHMLLRNPQNVGLGLWDAHDAKRQSVQRLAPGSPASLTHASGS